MKPLLPEVSFVVPDTEESDNLRIINEARKWIAVAKSKLAKCEQEKKTEESKIN